jgi:predicted Zn-dependent peptidase
MSRGRLWRYTAPSTPGGIQVAPARFFRMPSEPRPQLHCERHTLSNGLRVVVHRDPALPLVALDLWYHVGSKDERPGRTGFAHLFEHMLFQGSAHVGANDHFRLVQQVGGVANGSTWYDRTNYYETLPAHHLDLGLWLESDRMGYLLPAMTEQKLATQREVVINERRQRVDNRPYGLAMERLHELLYPEGHPYHWPVIGYPEDIAAADLDDVAGFFSTYYPPNNAVLALAGDLSPDLALERVELWFGSIPRGPEPPPVSTPPAPDGERRQVLEDAVELPRVYLGYPAPRYGESGWYAGDLLATVLAGGKSSVLYEDLVHRRQLAQEVGCYLFPTELTGTFYVVATARPETSPAELLAAIDEHLDRGAAEAPAEAHLERARNTMLTAFYQEAERLEGRADLLARATTFFDDPGHAATEPDRYRELTAEDLRRFAERWCRRDRRAVVTVVPRRERG